MLQLGRATARTEARCSLDTARQAVAPNLDEADGRAAVAAHDVAVVAVLAGGEHAVAAGGDGAVGVAAVAVDEVAVVAGSPAVECRCRRR